MLAAARPTAQRATDRAEASDHRRATGGLGHRVAKHKPSLLDSIFGAVSNWARNALHAFAEVNCDCFQVSHLLLEFRCLSTIAVDANDNIENDAVLKLGVVGSATCTF